MIVQAYEYDHINTEHLPEGFFQLPHGEDSFLDQLRIHLLGINCCLHYQALSRGHSARRCGVSLTECRCLWDWDLYEISRGKKHSEEE